MFHQMRVWKAISFLLALVLAGAGGAAAKKAQSKKTPKTTLRMDTSSFPKGGKIPDKYTCKGQNISPEISWKGLPPGTQSLVLICDDPDAPTQTWVHWVMYNIPANVYELTEAFPADDKMPNGILQGVNDFNKIGYGGPCPPSGMHRYYFKLYALDRFLEMAAGAGKDQVLKALKGHQLGFTQIMGLYGK